MHFDAFVGNERVKKTLSAYVDDGRFPHAVLLEGPEGSGRRTLARLLAKAAVCTAEKGEKPCGICPGCIKAAAGEHPDITEVDRGGSTRTISVNRVRELRESVYVLPNEASRRVVILAEANALTEPAQNALLKILEEPPAYALFILTCESRAQLLPTIQSRTLCLSLSEVTEDEAVKVLHSRFPGKEEEELRRSAAVFGGVIGRAIYGLEDGSFRQVTELASAMAEAVLAPDEVTLLRLTGRIEKDTELTDGVLGAMALIFRDALVGDLAGGTRLSTAPQVTEKLSRSLSRARLMRISEEIEALQKARRHNMNKSLLSTLLCARLWAAAHG